MRISASTVACSSDASCSLNGICHAGLCECDAGWTGVDCGRLHLAPVDPADGINAWARNTSSWGGLAVVDPDDVNLYHFYYSRFVNGCGLLCWVNASECVHATGPDNQAIG